jgi:hypothetical protein
VFPPGMVETPRLPGEARFVILDVPKNLSFFGVEILRLGSG